MPYNKIIQMVSYLVSTLFSVYDLFLPLVGNVKTQLETTLYIRFGFLLAESEVERRDKDASEPDIVGLLRLAGRLLGGPSWRQWSGSSGVWGGAGGWGAAGGGG